MLDVLFELRQLIEIIDIAVHAGADIAAFTRIVENLLMHTLFTADDRSEQEKFRTLGQGHYLFYYRVGRLSQDFLAADVAMRDAYARIEQTEIIVYFRHRADGGTRVFRGGFLVYGYRGGKPLYEIHIGLVYLTEKHTRI